MSNSMSKKISVVIPCYNYGHFLVRAVESITNDSLDDYEVVIVDDGSIDNTPSVSDRLAREYPGKVRYISQSNSGAAAARNRGIDSAQGEYLLFLDADDELMPGALDRIRWELSSALPDVDVLIGGHNVRFSDGPDCYRSPGSLSKQIKERVEDYLLTKKLVLSNGAVVFRRNVFDQYRYPEHFRCSEDISVFAYAISNFNVGLVDFAFCIVHRHAESLRHNATFSSEVGLKVVDEVFEQNRLPVSVMSLRDRFYIQRCLSVSRTAYKSGRYLECKSYFIKALKIDPKVVMKLSYSSKFFRAFLKGEK